MIIAENFETEVETSDAAELADELTTAYTELWAQFDPLATGFIETDDFCLFLQRLGPPMGLPQGCTRRDFETFAKKLDVKNWRGHVQFNDLLQALHRELFWHLNVTIPSNVVQTLPINPVIME